MERILKERRPLRTAFTRICNVIAQEPATVVGTEQGALLLQQLIDKYNRLDEVHVKTLSCMLDENKPEDEYQREFDVIEEYRDKFIEARNKLSPVVEANIQNINNASSITGSSRSSPTLQRRKFKLPQIKLKKFSGDALEWLGFWGQFKQIHEDELIVPEDKFQYLIQCMEPGSKAAIVVDSFPPSADNYPLAIERLKSRFAEEELLVQVYVRQLLSLVIENTLRGRSIKDLASLYDRLESYLAALATLGCTKDKYAYFLTPLVESSLPEEALRIWERERLSGGDRAGRLDSSTSLNELMAFLQREVRGHERVSLIKSGFGCRSQTEAVTKKSSVKPRKEPTASALIEAETKESSSDKRDGCIFCDKAHPSHECFTARRMSDEEKRQKLQKANRCFICWKEGHTTRVCKAKVSCLICQRRHYTVMCPDLKKRDNEAMGRKGESSTVNVNHKELNDGAETPTTKTLSVKASRGEVILMTLACRVRKGDRETVVRAILDTGTQCSYLAAGVAKRLKLKPIRKERIIHGLFGGQQTTPQYHPIYRVELADLQRSFTCTFEILEQEKICGEITPLSREVDVLWRVDNLAVAHHDETPIEIEMLLGADILGSLMTGGVKETECGLVAVHTRLGWTVMGHSAYGKSRDTATAVLNLHVREMKTPMLWEMDVLGIRDPVETSTIKESLETVLQRFQDTITISTEGRYQVDLPFQEKHPMLPDYKSMTFRRHQATMQRLSLKGLLENYQPIFDEWESAGIIEKIPSADLHKAGCYLPHRPVLKAESATTKIRPVFDASAKRAGEFSLNDCLEKGGNLIEEIPAILDKFRSRAIGVTADVEKAFLQLQVNPSHRDFLRFFNPNGAEYRHCRVVFGVTSSPFLLGAVLKYHFDRMRVNYKETVELIEHAFYVDNLATSVDTETDLQVLRENATQLMAKARMNLRCWTSNTWVSQMNGESVDASVLGLRWNIIRDTLSCQVSRISVEYKQIYTKRKVIATTQQVFDPIGFICPVMLLPKLLIKEMWLLNLYWDEPLPKKLDFEFKKWVRQLKKLGDVEIPRNLNVDEHCQIHVFVDASMHTPRVCSYEPKKMAS